MSPLALVVLLPLVAGTLLCAAAGRHNTPVRRRLTAWLAAAVAAGSRVVVQRDFLAAQMNGRGSRLWGQMIAVW